MKKITIGILVFLVSTLIVAALTYSVFGFIVGDFSCATWGGWGRFAYLIFGVFPALAIGAQVTILVSDKMED